MALHISPSGITCFPRVGTTFLTPSQYQKFHKMSTANRQISTISELLTNLSIFEPVQTRPTSSYCHIWIFGFLNFHNTALLQRGGEIPQGVLAAVFFGDVFQTYFHISGAGDEFYPYQNVSPNTLRCYEPSEKYKAIYHPQIPLRCITVQFDQEFIDQYTHGSLH